VPDTVVENNDCKTAAIQKNPTYPVVADGLYAGHDTSGSYSQEIIIPDMPCDKCTLQLTQFMQKHAPDCYYYHCMDLKIVAKPKPATDGGTVPSADSGQPAVPADSGTTPPLADSGSPQVPPTGTSDAGAGTADSSVAAPRPKDPGGCSTSPALLTLLLVVPLLLTFGSRRLALSSKAAKSKTSPSRRASR
jgi:hypothetical protein